MAPRKRKNPLEQRVEVTLFRDGGEYKDDCVVIINGKTFVIQRGVPVSVPRYVALALAQATAQKRRAQAMCDALQG